MANTILIKRGNKADLSSLELLPGELGVALDTQELYVGDAEGNVKIVKGGASGAVESADKLTVPRNIAISGDGTGSTTFDGSQDVTISLALSDTAVTAGTYTKVTVDSKGRVTKGENIAISDVTGLSNKITEIEGKITTAEGEIDALQSSQGTMETALEGKADKGDSLADYGITDAYTKTEVDGKVSDLTSQLGTANEAIESLETTIGGKADKSTTLAGYGIKDAYTKGETDGLLAGKASTTVVEGKADKSTTLAGYGIEDAYTKTEVDAKVSSVYKYKGSVANEAALPQEDQVVGDVYNVEDTGMNVAWDGTKWDKLGSTVDLSAYMTTETANSTFATITTVNGKANKATSLSGYGITDAYTKTEADTAFMNSEEVESAITAKGYATTAAMNAALSSKANSADVYTKTVADSTFLKEIPAEYITETELSAELANYAEKATTLSGYAITDAYTKTEVDSKLSGKLGTSDVIDGGTF